MEGKEQVITDLNTYLELKRGNEKVVNLEKENEIVKLQAQRIFQELEYVRFLVSLAIKLIPNFKEIALHEGIDLTIVEGDIGKLPLFTINAQNFEEVQRIKQKALNFEPIYEDGFQQANDTEGQQPSESREQGDKEDQTQEDQIQDSED